MAARGDGPPALRVRLLGGFAVQVGPRPVPPGGWRLRKARDLVKLLALAPEHRLHREQVMELLWPERDAAAAANNLHQVLYVARRALGPGCAALRDDLVALAPAGRLWVDVDAFEAAAERARATRDPGAYQEALGLYAGELLPEDRYEEWAATRRQELAQRHLALLVEAGELRLAAGEWDAATAALRQAVELDPSHEAAHRLLMRAYARSGRRQLALRQYQQLRATLRRELGIAPDQETERLQRDILEGRLAAEPAAEAPATGRRGARHNLPVRLSSFVGREHDLREVDRLLGGSRLLTLTGAGGAGKTRLALQVAEGWLERCPDGVWLAELAPLGDPAEVAQAVAEAVGARDRPGRDLGEALAAYLQPRRLLLVLDNCEHLVGACATLAERLLGAAPGLHVLATSRQPLRIAGEVVWRVPSLSLPDPRHPPARDQLLRYEAPRLFLERAAAVQPGFELREDAAADLARLCYRLDGLPLAIELAAARLPVLSVAGIAARLDDRFRLLVAGSRTALTRQQTLKATVDWSHELLSPAERVLFRRLSVFAGGCDLESVEAVAAGDGVAAADVLALFDGLVAKSLVAVVEGPGAAPRGRLLETMREYGRERLAEAGEARGLARRHADWYADLAARAEAGLRAAERPAWLERLEVEHDNLRAALGWLLRHDPLGALRLAAGLWPFWLWRGYLGEGLRQLRSALAAAREPTAERARALLGLCALTSRAETVAWGPEAEESLAISRGLGDHAGASRALYYLGVLEWLLCDWARSREQFERSRALARQAGDLAREASAVHGLGVVAWAAGDLEPAEALLQESLGMVRALVDDPRATVSTLTLGGLVWVQREDGSVREVFEETYAPFHEAAGPSVVGYVLAGLGNLARAAGEPALARERLRQALAVHRAASDQPGEAQALARLGNLATSLGEHRQARALLEQSLALSRQLLDSRGVGLALANLGRQATLEGDHDRARALLEESRALFQESGDLPGLGGALSNQAALHLSRGEVAAAVASFEEALAVLRVIGHPVRYAWGLVDLADAAAAAGERQRAGELLEEALGLFERFGDRRGIAQCRRSAAC